MLKKPANIQELPAERTTNHQPSMADLMANYNVKPVILNKGDLIEGTVISKTDSEILLDINAKSEGIISKHDFGAEKFDNLKIGDKLKAYIIIPENESGQTVMSLQKAIELPKSGGRFNKFSAQKRADLVKHWQKFVNARESGAKMTAQVIEVNKGGLMVSVDSIRGFIPSSHIGLSALSKVKNYADLAGQEIPVTVIEVDPNNNRLIFTTREQVSPEVKQKLAKFKAGEKVKGKIASVAPFGLVIDLDPSARLPKTEHGDGGQAGSGQGGVEGLIFSNDISWTEDLPAGRQEIFQVGEEVEAKILGVDEGLGRVNLSIKQLEEDPFEKLAEDFQTDDVITGTVLEVTADGVLVELKGVQGFLAKDKMGEEKLEVGQKTNFLVDSVDNKKRRINLAPFLTSTVGLIYK